MLLFLAVSGPSLIDSSTGNELVLIIDNSGSMAARDGTGTMRRQSRLERALTVGREWVQKSSPRKMDVFTWSHDIHLSQSLDSGPFTLAIIAQSHFAGGDFASLLQFASARRKGRSRVLVVTDSLSPLQQESLSNEEIEFRLVGEQSENWYISDVERFSRQGAQSGLKVRVGSSGLVEPAKLIISGSSGLLSETKLERRSGFSKWEVIPFENSGSQELEIRIVPRSLDFLSEDNFWILPAGEEKLLVEVAQNSSSAQKLFSQLVSKDPRFKIITPGQRADVWVKWVANPPVNPRPYHLYLQIPGLNPGSASHSFILDSTSRLTRFLDGVLFHPGSWTSNLDDDWIPLLGSNAKERGEQSIILAFSRMNRRSYYWNLRWLVSDFNDLGIPVMWENLVRDWRISKGLSSIAAVGDPRKGGEYQGKERALVQYLKSQNPNIFCYSGLYSSSSDKTKIFVKFPATESRLSPESHYQQLSIPRYSQSNGSNNQSVNLVPWIVAMAVSLLILEWVVFCRSA